MESFTYVKSNNLVDVHAGQKLAVVELSNDHEVIRTDSI